ncbi:hypothetical protein DID88_008382 [Monilinia fructigena]|uniref:EF-hand domain-containing protein n=1 Tax=Monilinia fructigena TaxID=38457 RepID=A0A395J7K6_9HELO|nr:hypothetical protein DID88_008382 [Monilinia fructigena]
MSNNNFLSDEEINEFLDDLDSNSNGYIEYDEVEHKLDEVHRELAPEPEPHNLHHADRQEDERHSFLRSVIGSDKDKIPRDEFANTCIQLVILLEPFYMGSRPSQQKYVEEVLGKEMSYRDYLATLSRLDRSNSPRFILDPSRIEHACSTKKKLRTLPIGPSFDVPYHRITLGTWDKFIATGANAWILANRPNHTCTIRENISNDTGLTKLDSISFFVCLRFHSSNGIHSLFQPVSETKCNFTLRPMETGHQNSGNWQQMASSRTFPSVSTDHTVHLHNASTILTIVLIIGSGIGVTPFSGILADLKAREESCSVPPTSSYTESSAMYNEKVYIIVPIFLSRGKNPGTDIHIITHVTQKKKKHLDTCFPLFAGDTSYRCTSRVTTYWVDQSTRFGRPDLAAIMDGHYEEMLRFYGTDEGEIERWWET